MKSVWPKVVKDRIQATYGYFAGSLIVTAASAYSIARSAFVHRWMRASPWLVSIKVKLKVKSIKSNFYSYITFRQLVVG